MTKTVLFYARYSTDRQHEVSIETQIELGEAFVKRQGWKLVETYCDAAISGTSYQLRPGIQKLIAHVKRERIDVVLCVTVDRLSRDVEHSAKILKELRYRDVELWTVHAGTPVTDLELAMRAALSHELVEQIRYRTREGMKTAVRKGKASTCLAYGYMLSQQRDANGDRMRGLREIEPDKAEIVQRIFKLYADGMSPRDIAHLLNNEDVTGPRGKKWRDTAIRGHVSRGTGILNNESYIGRMVWNKRNYRKNPDTERRTARVNDANEWVLTDVPSMRIVPDELWQRVKSRQKEIGDLFDFGQSNRLNATQRPEYLLSRMLECAECGGPYAISGKDRYSCTNHRKRLPIDELDGECCSNTKTIKRQDLEERVLNCIPVAFYSLDIFDRISEKMVAHEVGMLKRTPSRKDALNAELATIKATQKSLMQQIHDRHTEGRPRLAILDDQLDELEVTREKLVQELANAEAPAEDFQEKIAKLKTQFNPANVEIAIRRLLFIARNNADDYAKTRLMPIVRDLIQTVVIGKTPGHQPASLQVHGSIANIMASMEVLDLLEQQFIAAAQNDLMAKIASGEIDTEQKRKKLLDAYAEELRCKYPEWENLQVSVVAGAGFEPAAFRL
ncbi:recombinase family protein [Pararhizobium sp. YC-54]|uniref:recombinase family protein n=1 Tax=Pararhizobium sp. YC-54 TaxID=2986920 RepID=UPI0021F76243|nr:recombinase family protein [Pararhizobium sp. YC-54]MCW0001348.1 recombinase family protein [Pararhizobium sp. YC-54]